jgi:hypothetical protein
MAAARSIPITPTTIPIISAVFKCCLFALEPGCSTNGVAVGSVDAGGVVEIVGEVSSGSLADGFLGAGVEDGLKLVDEVTPFLIDNDGELELSAHPSYQPLTPEKIHARQETNSHKTRHRVPKSSRPGEWYRGRDRHSNLRRRSDCHGKRT